MTLESGMMIGRYCIAFTDTGRVLYIYFFLFYPSRSPTMATSMAATVMAEMAAARNEESHVGGRVNRKKNNSVSDSSGVCVSLFLLRSRFFPRYPVFLALA